MIRIRQVIRKHRLLAILVCSACLGILTGVLVWAGKARPAQGINPIVTSKTTAIGVVEAGNTNLGTIAMLAVRLRNVTDKDIDAYAIGSGQTWVTRSYYLTDESFKAGTTITHLIFG